MRSVFVVTAAVGALAGAAMLDGPRLGAQAIGVALQKPEELAFAQPIRTGTSAANRGGGTISQGQMVPEYQVPTFFLTTECPIITGQACFA